MFVSAQVIAIGGTVQKVLSAGTGPGAENPPQPAASIVLKARKGNTSPLYLGIATTGGGTAGSSLSSTTGFELQPGDSVGVDLMGIGLGYIIGATANDRYDILMVGP
jgi:hypothetical protein